MNAFELRIGNFISYQESNGRVNTVALSLVNVGAGLGNIATSETIVNVVNYDDCIPIPLDERWLEAFGFTESNDIWQAGLVTLVQEDGSFVFNGLKAGKIVISHVHQLQNLYFALNNHELKIENSNLLILPS